MKQLALVAFLVGVVGVAAGADSDITGTWKYKAKFGDKEVERTLKLEGKDGKVTGEIPGFGGKGKATKIDEGGTIKNNEFKFTTTGTFGKDKDMKVVTTYTGKVDGDTIKGKIVRKAGDKETETEFEAKKEKVKD